jgi:dimethylaniline monooxygenase (N-oxide forming)
MPTPPRTCILGAGSSGIAMAKQLAARGLPFDCFEKSDRVGGNWVFQNKNGMSSAYRSLHINTSRDKMHFSDFPMPRDYPHFPHHEQVAAYFDAYVDHFGFRDRIRFNTAVTRAQRQDDGQWRITLESGESLTYDALAVCNGHHWDARWPSPAYPGHFDGPQIHSHYYIDETDPVDVRGKRVLIVGFGNSAMDIACEIGRKNVTPVTYLSTRRASWVIPRFVGNKLLDADNPHPSEDPAWLIRVMPVWMKNWLAAKKLSAVHGSPADHGLPEPEPYFSTHPTISQDIYNRIGSGDVVVRPAIKALRGKQVEFVNGQLDDIDVIIWCTGYNIRFPFFDPGFLDVSDNDIALWQRVWDPRFTNLMFIGLVQPWCAIMPIAEQQAIIAAEHLAGSYALPPLSQMAAETHAMHEAIKAGYVNTARHTIQVDCGEYTYALRQELRRGQARAKRAA